MAVVLPDPAGAIASCTRAPEVAISPHQVRLRGVEGDAVGDRLQQRQVDVASGTARPPCWRAASTRNRSSASTVAEVNSGSRRPRRRWTPSRRRSTAGDRGVTGSAGSAAPTGPGPGPGDDLVDQRVDVGAGREARGVGADLTFGFGPDMPHLPGGPAVSTTRAVARRRAAIPATSRSTVPRARWPRPAGARRSGRCGRPSAWSPPRTARPRPARPALLGFGAGFVLGVAGLQGGLLGQLDRLDRGRRPAVLGLELRPPARPGGRRSGPGGSTRPWRVLGHADDLADARLPAAAAAAASERSLKVSPSRRCSSASRRVLYRSEAVTVALNSTRPSTASHRPGVPSAFRTRTLLETATWVCRSGSPARESRWSNAAAIRPVVSSCCTPSRAAAGVDRRPAPASRGRPRPRRGARRGSAPRPRRGAIAHNADTDLTGVNVRSNPATALVAGRECRAMNEDSSRGSFGARPYSSANISRPTSVRIRARSAAASGQSRGTPRRR